MVSRENTVSVACIALALVGVYAILQVPDRPEWAPAAVLLGVGVILPLAVNGYLDGSADPDGE
jgi:hypothetical protein